MNMTVGYPCILSKKAVSDRLDPVVHQRTFQSMLAYMTLKGLTSLGVFTVLCLCAVDLQAQECSPSKTNGDCVIIIDRENPSSPLPVRAWPESKVTVRVTKRPLEKIQFDATFTDIPKVDPFVAIFGSFLTPLKAVTFLTRTSTNDARLLNEFAVDDLLIRIDKIQKATSQELERLKSGLDNAGNQLRQLQEKKAGTWTREEVRVARDALILLIKGTATTPGVGLQTPVTGNMQVLREQLDTAIKEFAKISNPSQELTNLLNEVVANQARLEESFKSVQASQATLLQAANILERLDINNLQTYDEQTFSSTARDVDRSATIKVSAQDLISKATTNLVTVTIIWGSTHWEMSAGVLFSALINRSFQNTPIIIDGQPSTDPAGKINTVVTETSTRPTVVPIFFAHYRLVEASRSGRRLALLLSGGIGINPYSATADFGAGLTFSYRNFMLTPLLHFGRDLRLTNGLTVGDELGSSPPALTTERYWVRKFGVAISYRLPIP